MSRTTRVHVNSLLAALKISRSDNWAASARRILNEMPIPGTRVIVIEATRRDGIGPTAQRVFSAEVAGIDLKEGGESEAHALLTDVRSMSMLEGKVVVGEQLYEDKIGTYLSKAADYSLVQILPYESGLFSATCILREQERVRDLEARIGQLNASFEGAVCPESVRALAAGLTPDKLEILLTLARSSRAPKE